MTTVVILQPGYMPWLGFFDQMRRADVFVYYDDVQFDKHGWRNRNRIKSPNGALWLTVPVVNSGRHGQRICEVEIDNRSAWGRKHCLSIAQNYARAPYLTRYLPQIENLLMGRWDRLVDLDLAATTMLCEWIGLRRQIERSSTLGIAGGQSQRLIDICLHFNADCYLSGDSAKDYLDIELFTDNGLKVEWQSFLHPVYPQLHGKFLPYLSILDLVMNVGEESLDILTGES